ncbi:hypothetical protein DTO021D3_3764 [Paecilomyces variotii]|nr:hypothetical protein DTO032I3_5529 [Paecilomyces variotii]KAJ9279308.1 hypothetical protein DTO021D3_3764 [Paecilomyces variotii]KAJ9344739.1 hypothetical protein DTO027B6_2921 [Paecilomyces variotii]KAJ9350651.1 hypothetical protein DTO027B9_6844 [Paecilomyces variotii]KAJ9385727.1 hypothetical protein DTO032I4_4068 [Paecilomyces variotii]
MAETSANVNLNLIPAMQAPPGEVSNLKDPANMNQFMYLTAGVCLSCSTLAVIFRLFVKARIIRAIQLEEFILSFSLAGLISLTGVMIQSTLMGQGVHQWNVSAAHAQKIVEYANIIEIVYCPAILGAKVAMLLQIKRIFVVGKKGALFWLHEIILWLNVPTYTGLMFSFIFSCVPREKIWNSSVPGHCVSVSTSLIATSVLNVLSDVTMLFLPVAVIMQLHLPTRSKIILSAIFGTGVLTVIASVIRLIYTVRLIRTEDFTRAIMPVGLWAIAEVTSVTLAGAIPLLPGFVKFVRNGNDSSGTRSGSRWASNYGTGSRGQPHYPMDSETETIINADSLKDNAVPLGIMKTVQVQAVYDRS